MNGLTKLAWSYEKVRQANQAFNDFRNNNYHAMRLTKGELRKIQNYIKEKEKLDVGYLTGKNDYSGLFAQPKIIEMNKKLQAEGKEMDDITSLINQRSKGEKDGFVVSGDNLNTLAHELGHAIDHKKNPQPPYSRNIAYDRQKQISFPAIVGFVGGATASATTNSSESDSSSSFSPTEAGIIGAGTGLVAAAPISLSGTYLINRSENAANRYGEEILRGTNDAEDVQRIPLFRQQGKLGKKTYTLEALRHLKNIPIAAAVGATGGVGLATLAKRYISEDKEADF